LKKSAARVAALFLWHARELPPFALVQAPVQIESAAFAVRQGI